MNKTKGSGKAGKNRLNESEILQLLRGEEEAICRMIVHYRGLICCLCHTYACQQGIRLSEEETKDLHQSVVIKLVTGQLEKFKV